MDINSTGALTASSPIAIEQGSYARSRGGIDALIADPAGIGLLLRGEYTVGRIEIVQPVLLC